MNQQTRLCRLSRSTLAAAVMHPGTPCKVALHPNTAAGDLACSLAAAAAYARDCGWHVVDRVVDAAADTEPWSREAWPEVLRKLRGSFPQGVVTADRSGASVADEPYEQTLLWLFDHLSFVAHAQPSPVTSAVAR